MVYTTMDLIHASSSLRTSCVAILLFVLSASNAFSQPVPERPVVAGIKTSRTVHGVPYELAGHRIVFTNWYYIQPGDLDWRNGEGKSVYVSGNEGLFDANHIGINAPRGIKLAAEKPQIMGPIDRPQRIIVRDEPVTLPFQSVSMHGWRCGCTTSWGGRVGGGRRRG